MSDAIDTGTMISTPVRRWLSRVREGTAPAIVLGGSCNGLSFARSLGRRGVPVLMLETKPLLGVYTRYADVLILPEVREEPDRWLQLLLSIGRRLKQPAVLFSTSDGHTQLMAKNSASLEEHFRFLIPDAGTLDQIHNKRLQYGIAVREGIPIPTVHYPESVDQVRAIVPQLNFPVLLKPYDSDASREKLKQKLLVVNSPEELIAAYERVKAMNVRAMIQEFIRGEDSDLYGYMGFWDREGNERAWITKQKLRQNPPGFGDGSLQVAIVVPEVLELTRRLLRAFRYRGFVGTEFKRDRRDGTFRLMEINARTESGNQMPITAGVDLPWIGYQYLTGGSLPSEPIGPVARPVKYLNEEWDIQSFMILRRSSKMSLPGWLWSIRDAEALAIWAWDDPRPFVTGLGRSIQMLNPPSVPVLTFHVIGDGPGPIFYPAEMFRRCMARLHDRGFRTILLSELIKTLQLGLPLPGKTVVLTFDDGDRSVADIAWPILRGFNMTATIFLLTEPSRMFEGRPLMSWEQAREIQQQGGEFGCHSATHPDFSRASEAQIEKELRDSIKVLGDELGIRPRGFAYPYSRYNDRAREIVDEYFDFVCTDHLGLVNQRSDPKLLERAEMYYLRGETTFDLIFSPALPWYLRARNIPRRARRILGI